MGYCDSDIHGHPIFDELEAILLESKALAADNKKLIKELNDVALALKCPATYTDVLKRIKGLLKDEGDADKLLELQKSAVILSNEDRNTLRFTKASVGDDFEITNARKAGQFYADLYERSFALLDRLLGETPAETSADDAV